MRIGLDFRFLALERQGHVRGIAQFTQEQTRSTLRIDSANTYLLLCDPGTNIDSIHAEIRSAPNAHVVCAPAELGSSMPRNDSRQVLLARFALYMRWLEDLRLDLFHATNPAMPECVLAPGFDVCPYVATAYDLIPLLYPAQYFPHHADRETYDQRLLFLQQATAVAAISHATARDVTEHLGVSPERIHITHPAPAPCFRPLEQEVTRAILDSLNHPTRRLTRRRVVVPAEYVLCVSELHYSKNLPALVSAYAELPGPTRRRFPLVAGGHVSPGQVDTLHSIARELDIEGDLRITGRVSNDELAALYNGATVLAHPSHYEGFGLPVAEAMRCGTPVITTTRSALPETAGDAAVFVDSDDPRALNRALDSVLHDSNRRDDMRRLGIAHAARFTSQRLGSTTVRCYEAATMDAARAAPARLRVAVWSSDRLQVNDDLVAALAAAPDLDVHVFLDDHALPSLSLLSVASVHHWSDFDRAARHPFDTTIYEVGASRLHDRMHQAMLSRPGIVVLHDLRWSHAVLAASRGRPDGAHSFRAALEATEGDAAAREWERLLRLASRCRDDAEIAFLDAHPMLRDIVSGATCCVATTPAIEAELRRRYPRADAVLIPAGVRDPQREGFGADRAAARAYLGLDREAFMVVAPLSDNDARAVHATLAAFSGLIRAGVDAALTVIGPISEAVAAEVHAQSVRLGAGGAVRVVRHLTRTLFEAHLAASDVVLVLGDLTNHGVPDAVVHSLAAGRCVMMNESPGSYSIPEAACVRVTAESPPAAEVLADLARDAARRDTVGRAAREHYEQTAGVEPMAQAYRALIHQLAICPATEGRVPTSPAQQTARAGSPAPRSGALAYSKACELEDFEHSDLRPVIRDVCAHKREAFGERYPSGFEYRKDWEVAMAVRTLADHGALRVDARILGVAAGTEDTVFYLTRFVGEVVAIDRYLDPDGWDETAPTTMLVNPAQLAPYAFDAAHLTVRHMDARILDFPDESFDGVFSSGSIEHFGDLQTIASAAYEMGRVLKPGGVLTLSTELLLSPDPCGPGALYPRTRLLSPLELQQYIVQASGLELIGELDASISHWTRGTSRSIVSAVTSRQRRSAPDARGSRGAEWACWDMPHIVMEWEDKRFTSVHLALRRALLHPSADNSWARPPAGLRAEVERDAVDGTELTGVGRHGRDGGRAAAELRRDVRRLSRARDSAEERLTELLAHVTTASYEISTALQEAAMPRAGVYNERRRTSTPPPEVPGGVTVATVACPITSPIAPPYTVVVEDDPDDPMSAVFLAGRGAEINTDLASLVLALVPEGGVFVDVGANVGSMSLPLAASGRQVVSIEAAPGNAALLQQSAALSGLSDLMRVVASAAGDRVGEAAFLPHGCHGQLVDGRAAGATLIPITTVDAVVDTQHLDRVDLVKIDVDGADYDVLRGMVRLAHRADAPHLLVECCPHTLSAFGHTVVELVALLETYGYVVYNVDGRRLMRRRPDEVQLTTVMDVLAVKGGINRLAGWRVEPAMSRQELVERFVAESHVANPDCRAGAARAANELHPDILTIAVVAETLRRLRADPDPTVRAATAWWQEPQPVPGARR